MYLFGKFGLTCNTILYSPQATCLPAPGRCGHRGGNLLPLRGWCGHSGLLRGSPGWGPGGSTAGDCGAEEFEGAQVGEGPLVVLPHTLPYSLLGRHHTECRTDRSQLVLLPLQVIVFRQSDLQVQRIHYKLLRSVTMTNICVSKAEQMVIVVLELRNSRVYEWE